MSISKTARFRVRAAHAGEAIEAIETFVRAIEADEPATRLYATFRREGDPIEFLHVMVFEDSKAEKRHRSSSAVRRFTDVLYPITVDGVRFDDWSLIATTRLR